MSRADIIATGNYDATVAAVLLGLAALVGLGLLVSAAVCGVKGKGDAATGLGGIGGFLLAVTVMVFLMCGNLFTVWYAPDYYVRWWSTRWTHAGMYDEHDAKPGTAAAEGGE
jgi:hypothetical protein